MALPQSAVSELLEAFRTGDGVDMIRESVRTVLQALVELEAAGVIGAERSERTEARVTERNGTRPELLATKAGDIELRNPQAPQRLVHVHGISTRSVDDLVVALGADSGTSKSEGSRVCEQLDESVGAFRTRLLDHTAFPYVHLDATSLHVRNRPGKGSQVVSMAVVVATGIAADGSREVLGLDVGDSEDETFWRAFFCSASNNAASPGCS
jgi:putative transposase